MDKNEKNDSVGSVTSMVLSATDWAAQFAPRMRLIAATLMPFDDRIWGWASGPQPQSKHYDESEWPWIEIQVPHSQYHDSSVYIRITESSVTYWEMIGGKDGETYCDGKVETTLPKVFQYLASLPRDPGSHLFEREAEEETES